MKPDEPGEEISVVQGTVEGTVEKTVEDRPYDDLTLTPVPQVEMDNIASVQGILDVVDDTDEEEVNMNNMVSSEILDTIKEELQIKLEDLKNEVREAAETQLQEVKILNQLFEKYDEKFKKLETEDLVKINEEIQKHEVRITGNGNRFDQYKTEQ